MLFDTQAGKQCGPFVLGMSLFSAMRVIKTLDSSSSSASSMFKKTIITYSRLHPVDSPVIVDVKSVGIRLRFESATQCLFLIEVYDLQLVSVSLNGYLLGGETRSREAMTLRALYPVLGATHAGFRRKELGKDAFCFQYPGFLIQFSVPENEVFQGIPFVLHSSNQSPIVARFFIHGVDFPKVVVARNRTTAVEGAGSLEVMFKEDGPVLTFPSNGVVIKLGKTTCQEVLSWLHAPGATCLKHRETFGGSSSNQQQDLDYFYNYFSLGIDLLFDGKRHVVKQAILHANLVPHAQFNVYAKCLFTIKFQLKARKKSSATAVAAPPAPTPSKVHHMLPSSFEELLMGTSNSSNSSSKNAAPQAPTPATTATTKSAKDLERLIHCDDKWTAIANKLDLQNDQPMVHEPPEQPFGPCLLYATKRTVFEIDQQSQHIATFTVF